MISIFLQRLLTVVFLLSPFALCAQTSFDWEHAKSVDGIKVFTRKSQKSAIKEIRIETYFDTDISTFLTILKDANSYIDWVYKCKESKKLDIINETSYYYYVVTDLPFPLNDRDLIIFTEYWVDPNTGNITTFSEAKPNYFGLKDEFVRIPFFQSSWKISNTNNGQIFVEYESLTDPGGSLPSWLVNLALTSGPIKTMQALHRITQNQ